MRPRHPPVRIARHGLFWLALSFTLDNATSWLMMSLLGADSEGNSVQRLLFTERDAAALSQWLAANYLWLAFFAIGFAVLFVSTRFEPLPGGISSGALPFYSVLFTWIPALWRFYGAGTNVYALALHLGNPAATSAWLALTFGAIAVELLDLASLLGFGVPAFPASLRLTGKTRARN